MTKCEVCGKEFDGLAMKIYEPSKAYVCKLCKMVYDETYEKQNFEKWDNWKMISYWNNK